MKPKKKRISKIKATRLDLKQKQQISMTWLFLMLIYDLKRTRIANHLLAIDVRLKEARVVRMRSNFGFDESGGVVLAMNFGSDGWRLGFGDCGEEVIGSEHRIPITEDAGRHEKAMVIGGEDQVLRRHQGLVGVLRRQRHSVDFLHDRPESAYLSFVGRCLAEPDF